MRHIIALLLLFINCFISTPIEANSVVKEGNMILSCNCTEIASGNFKKVIENSHTLEIEARKWLQVILLISIILFLFLMVVSGLLFFKTTNNLE